MEGIGLGEIVAVRSGVEPQRFYQGSGNLVSQAFDADGAMAAVRLMAAAVERDDLLTVFTERYGGLFSEATGLGGSLLKVPHFVPREDAVAIVVCMLAASQCAFSGPGFASLMHRAELRCELATSIAAEAAMQSGVALTEIYLQAVQKVEEGLGFSTRFVKDVVSLSTVTSLMSSGNTLLRADELSDDLAANLALRKVGEHFVVADPMTSYEVMGRGRRQQASDFGGLKVVPMSVYTALLGLATRAEAGCVFVSLSRRRDGIYVMSPTYSASESYAVGKLPAGLCELPGGYGRLVDTRLMSDLCEVVHALPLLQKQQGFCYLGCLPPDVRVMAVGVLGREPSVSALRKYFPDCTEWCEKEADVRRVGVRAGVVHWHVNRPGNLPPNIPGDDRLGSAFRLAEQTADKMLEEMIGMVPKTTVNTGAFVSPPGSAFSPPSSDVGASSQTFPGPAGPGVAPGGFAFPASTSVSRASAAPASFFGAPMSVVQPPSVFLQSGGTSVHHRSVSESGVGSLNAATQVSLTPQGLPLYRPEWKRLASPHDDMWVSRLSSGGPVGVEMLLSYAKGKDGSGLTVPVDGVSVMPGPGAPLNAGEAKLIPWDVRTMPLFDHRMEVVKLGGSKRKRYLAIHPCAGSYCRYEVSSDNAFQVGDCAYVPGRSVVVWAGSDVVFDVDGKTTIVRVWSDQGMSGIGQVMVTLARVFSATVVRPHGYSVAADRVVGLGLTSTDQSSGLVQYKKSFKMRGVSEKVHFYLFDEVDAKPALLTVTGGGLRYVVVHGVRLPVTNGEVRVVTVASLTTVRVVVEAVAHRSQITAQVFAVADLSAFSAFVERRHGSVAVAGLQSRQITY